MERCVRHAFLGSGLSKWPMRVAVLTVNVKVAGP